MDCWTLRMEAVYCSQTSVTIYHLTQHTNPEDLGLHQCHHMKPVFKHFGCSRCCKCCCVGSLFLSIAAVISGHSCSTTCQYLQGSVKALVISV